jgi:hypothetical protein
VWKNFFKKTLKFPQLYLNGVHIAYPKIALILVEKKKTTPFRRYALCKVILSLIRENYLLHKKSCPPFIHVSFIFLPGITTIIKSRYVIYLFIYLLT